MPENIIEKIENKIEKNPLVKDFSQELNQVKKNPRKKIKTIVFAIIIILAGVTTGYFFSKRDAGPMPVARDVSEGDIEKGMTVGVVDEKTFKDSAEGKLVSGGIEGEGSHHLERPGGETQSVYLTSSIVDLDKFVGRDVKVWGETFSAKKAGWLMDVGKLQVL